MTFFHFTSSCTKWRQFCAPKFSWGAIEHTVAYIHALSTQLSMLVCRQPAMYFSSMFALYFVACAQQSYFCLQKTEIRFRPTRLQIFPFPTPQRAAVLQWSICECRSRRGDVPSVLWAAVLSFVAVGGHQSFEQNYSIQMIGYVKKLHVRDRIGEWSIGLFAQDCRAKLSPPLFFFLSMLNCSKRAGSSADFMLKLAQSGKTTPSPLLSWPGVLNVTVYWRSVVHARESKLSWLAPVITNVFFRFLSFVKPFTILQKSIQV